MTHTEDELLQVWCCIYNYPQEGELVTMTEEEFRGILHLLQDPDGAMDFCLACNEVGAIAMFVQGVDEDNEQVQGVSITRDELREILDGAQELSWEEILITPENTAPPQPPKKWEIN